MRCVCTPASVIAWSTGDVDTASMNISFFFLLINDDVKKVKITKPSLPPSFPPFLCLSLPTHLFHCVLRPSLQMFRARCKHSFTTLPVNEQGGDERGMKRVSTRAKEKESKTDWMAATSIFQHCLYSPGKTLTWAAASTVLQQGLTLNWNLPQMNSRCSGAKGIDWQHLFLPLPHSPHSLWTNTQTHTKASLYSPQCHTQVGIKSY